MPLLSTIVGLDPSVVVNDLLTPPIGITLPPRRPVDSNFANRREASNLTTAIFIFDQFFTDVRFCRGGGLNQEVDTGT